MEYKGKLYGKLGNDLYFDTSHTTYEWDKMEAKIKELEQQTTFLDIMEVR